MPYDASSRPTTLYPANPEVTLGMDGVNIYVTLDKMKHILTQPEAQKLYDELCGALMRCKVPKG
jgi:hypothetical protein